jgi:hypothetical protein
MARAYGSSAHLLMKRETVYGQAATGNYICIPFNRCNLGSEQGLVDDPVLGQGRDPLAPLQDVITDEGDIIVPVDPRYLGLWLTGLFGDPDTTDNLDGSWDHEFASGGDDLPSYTLEVGMPKVPAFFRHAGVKLNSIVLEFTCSGPAAATINAIAQGETRFGATQGGTPSSLTFSRISQFHDAQPSPLALCMERAQARSRRHRIRQVSGKGKRQSEPTELRQNWAPWRAEMAIRLMNDCPAVVREQESEILKIDGLL